MQTDGNWEKGCRAYLAVVKNWTDTSVKYVVWALSLQIRKQQYKAVILVPIYRVFRLNSKKVNLGGLRRVSEKN